jgi:hypothetical protein
VAYLNTNSFYSSFAKKTKGSGSVPSKTQGIISPGSSTGLLGAPKPPSSTPSSGSSTSTGAPTGVTVTPPSLPPDPAYQLTLGALGGTRDNTLAALAQNRQAGLSSYGYTEDPSTHAIAFDPNNPYSQAALLRKHFQQSKLGNTTSYAAAGQLYAGSLQNAQNASTDQFDQGDNALKTAIQNFLAKNTQDASAANNAYDFNAAQALGQSVQNAPSNPLYSPAASAAIDPASVGLKFPLAPGYELYRDPVTGELKARKV